MIAHLKNRRWNLRVSAWVMANQLSGKDRRVALLREFEGSGLSMAEFSRRLERKMTM